MLRWFTSLFAPPVDLTNRKASLRLDPLEERALLSADPLDPLAPVPTLTADVASVSADTPATPQDLTAADSVVAVLPVPLPEFGGGEPPSDVSAGSGSEVTGAGEFAAADGWVWESDEWEFVWVADWADAGDDSGAWALDEITTEPPVPDAGSGPATERIEREGEPEPQEEGDTFPIAAATDGPAMHPPATPPAAPPAASGNQAYDWFVRRMGEAAPQPAQPNQSTQPTVDWLARISDPNDPLGRSFNGPELPLSGGDKPLRPRFVPVVQARDPFALEESLRTLNSLLDGASGQTFDWDRIDYWAKRDAERLRPQLDMATRVGVVAADVMSIGTEIAVGMTTLEFGGFVLVAHGFDRAVARIESLRTGTPQMSLTADYLFHRTVGLSKADATAADDLAGDLLPVGTLGVKGVYRLVRGTHTLGPVAPSAPSVYNATKIKGGEPLSAAELQTYVDALRAQGAEVILGEEATRRVQSVGAKALYVPSGGNPGQIVLPPGVTRVQVLEEIHHFTQSRMRGFPNRSITHESQRSAANIVTELLELEAKDKLILHGQRAGWHKSVIQELKEARAIHLENLRKYLPNPPKGVEEVRGWDTSVIDDFLRQLNR